MFDFTLVLAPQSPAGLVVNKLRGTLKLSESSTAQGGGKVSTQDFS
jgi:hypothetical protein